VPSSDFGLRLLKTGGIAIVAPIDIEMMFSAALA
jgi:hypothetical protein